MTVEKLKRWLVIPVNLTKSRAEIEADIARFQKKHLQRLTPKQVRREILVCLRSKQEFTAPDLAMELRTPLKAVIKALVELESQKRIHPISDALRSGEDTEPIELNPNVKPSHNERENLQPISDIKGLLSLLEDRCFAFEAARMHAYERMMSGRFF